MSHDPHAVEAHNMEMAMPSIVQILAILNTVAPLLAELPKVLAQIQADLAALKAKP